MAQSRTEQSRRPLRRSDFIAVGVILVCCAVVFVWVGLAFLPASEDVFRRVIVNDDYGALTAALNVGGEFRQTVMIEGSIRGMRLPVRVFGDTAKGYVDIVLLDHDDNKVASCRANAADMVDGHFHLFRFEGAVDAKDGLPHTLVLTADMKEGEIAFLKSEGRAADYKGEASGGYALSSFRLTENGVPQEGTLALQYVTRYSGKFLYVPYIVFAVLLTVFFEFLYLSLFVFLTPLHRVFLVSSLVLGTVFLFVIPFRTAPDEYVHIANAYGYSNAVYGVNEQKNRNSLTVRAGDEMFLRSYDFDATDVFAYQEVYEGLLDSAPEGESVLIPARKGSGVFPLMYFPQALGIILARLIGAGRVGLLFLGRFANLVFYSLTVMLAIKHMPFMKHALFIAALMPMCMQLAASFSYDAYVISLCFLFTALVFRLVFEKGQMALKDFVWPALTALLIAPAKAVYFPVLLLLFLIPAAKFTNKRFVAARLVVLVAAVFLWSAFNLETLKAAAGTLKTQQPSASFARSPENAGEPTSVGNAALHLPGYTEGQAEFSSAKDPVYPVRDNNEAYQRFTLGYVLRHIPQTLMLTARTFWEQCPLWLQGLVGGRLGEIIAIEIEINWLFVLGLAVLLLASSLADNSDAYVLQKRERRFSLLISLLVFLLFFFGCVTWTPINYDTVFGVQGRYFIPVLPLALLAFRGDNLRFKRQASKGLCFAALALTALSALQAFTIIIQR